MKIILRSFFVLLIFFSGLAACAREEKTLEESKDVVRDKTLIILELTESKVEIFEGQSFDPEVYLSSTTSDDALDVLDITNPVKINEPGEYVVLFRADDVEEELIVTVLEDPITLSRNSLSLELGDEFNPNELVDPIDLKTYDIEIENNVDITTPGVYTVNYRYQDVNKSLTVTVKEPNTIEYLLRDSEWLLETTKKLGYAKNTVIEVDGGDTNGIRQSLVAVDVGFGTREYWAYTNQFGQLVAVIAENIILQDESTETLLGDGRYYTDEANVPGTEKMDLDNGHVIADSLGGVSNAYNITPQNSNLNRNGDQAYMEEWIQKANGAEEFIAVITYPDPNTQIPSHYRFSYIINGNKVTDDFDNKNPETTVSNPIQDNINTIISTPIIDDSEDEESIEDIDTNGNGVVTIAEAKKAGFTMPIRSDHWLYKYMVDGDQDGMVGE